MNKEKILKMTKREIEDYKWDEGNNIGCNNCNNCSNCIFCNSCKNCYICDNCNYCYSCYNCHNCENCYNCRYSKNLKYAILNVELTKEEYEKKMKELN